MCATPSATDVYVTATLDLSATHRQAQAMVEKLVWLNPSQIRVEWTAFKQAKVESTYQANLKGHYQPQSQFTSLHLLLFPHSVPSSANE